VTPQDPFFFAAAAAKTALEDPHRPNGFPGFSGPEPLHRPKTSVSQGQHLFGTSGHNAFWICLRFFVQGDKLKELGLPVPALNDRAKTQRPLTANMSKICQRYVAGVLFPFKLCSS